MKTPRNKQGDVLAPGFNEDIAYQQGNRVKSVQICNKGNQFISLDQNSIHIWNRAVLDPDRIETSHVKTLQQQHYVSAVCHALPTGLAVATPIIFASCLDNTLKVYSMEKMRLRSSVSWHCGIVTTMLYNSKNDTIITTGAAGVKLWASTADTEGFHSDKALPASDRPWLSPAGDILPWCYGRYQQAKEQLTFQVPGLKTKITAADVAVPDAVDMSWCNTIQLLLPQQLLLVMHQADVYGFDAVTGSRLYAWQSLAQQALVDMVYSLPQQQLVTASREPTVVVWQLQQDGRLGWVRSLGRFAAGVHCVAAAVGRPWLLTASLDGFVVAWSTENWQQLFRMKLANTVSCIQFYKPDHFLCVAGNQVKFFKLRQAAQPWMQPSSPLTSLTPLGYGLLMATFSDSSIRLLDATSTAADRSALTTVPQLSSAGLLRAAADLAGGRLFALLRNGHVHVWELHLTKPPALQEAWTHLERERCCSVAFMEGSAMDPATAKHLGLSVRPAAPQAASTDTAGSAASNLMQQQQQQQGEQEGTAQVGTAHLQEVLVNAALKTEDHLFVGTAKGEVLVCDVARQGLLVLRVPVLKLLPVTLLLLDFATNRMVVGGGNVVKLWDVAKLTCIAEFEAKRQVLCGHILDGLLLLGSSCGRCHMLDLLAGIAVSATAARATNTLSRLGGTAAAASGSSSSSDHDGPVTCISGSSYLQHFVTCSVDGYVKVYSLDRSVKASVYLATPLAAVAFLNDNGDLLVAPAAHTAKALLLVKADSYAVTARSYRGEKGTIFDDVNADTTAADSSTQNGEPLAPGRSPLAAAPADITTPTPAYTPHQPCCLGHLRPLDSPSSMDPEPSIKAATVVHSSTRPAVDLDQNRAKAELARALAPARSAYRQNTISKAVEQNQQQQQHGEHDVDASSSSSAVVSAVVSPAATAAMEVGGSSLETAQHAVEAQPVQQQQQQQQGLSTLSTVTKVCTESENKQFNHQRQQAQQQVEVQSATSSLPQVRQLPAAFTGLNISLGRNLQHHQKQQAGLAASTPTLPPILAMRQASAQAAAAAQQGRCGGCMSAGGSPAPTAGHGGSNAHRKRNKNSAFAAGSSKAKQLQTQYEFDLKALQQQDKWRAAGALKGDSADNSSNDDGNSSSSSSSSDGDGDEGDDSSGSSSTDEADEQCAAGAAKQQRVCVRTVCPVEAAADAVTSAVFYVGQLSVRTAPGTSSSGSNTHQPHQQQQGFRADITAAAPAVGTAGAAEAANQADMLASPIGGTAAAVTKSAMASAQSTSRSSRGAPLSQQRSSGSTMCTALGPSISEAGATTRSLHTSSSAAVRRLAGLQPSMRSAVAVVQDADVFLEDAPPAAELAKVLRQYKAEAARDGWHSASKRKQKNKNNSSGKAVCTAAGVDDCKDVWQHAVHPSAGSLEQQVAAAAAGGSTNAKHKKKKKKKRAGRSKPRQQQPVYLSQMDYLMHTVGDAGVVSELKEAEAHDMRQAAALKHWLTVPHASAGTRAVANRTTSSSLSGVKSTNAGGSSSGGHGIGATRRMESLLISLSRKGKAPLPEEETSSDKLAV